METDMAWIDVPLGLASLCAGIYHIALLISGRARSAPAAAHAAMGIGMAAMFVPAADPLPGPVWTAVFAVVAAWFGVAGLRAGTFLGEAGHHAVGAVAMIYMLQGHTLGAVGAAASGAIEPEHAHHGGGAAPPLLTTAIALAFVAWFVADVARLLLPYGGTAAPVPVGSGSGASGSTRPLLSAGLDRHVAVPNAVMSAAMAVMFLTMA
jgi:hypothetical protein